METIFWTDALDEMRKLTKEGRHFSFSYAKYNRKKLVGGEVVDVLKAQLRKSLPKDAISNLPSDMLLPYINESGEFRVCYKCLLLSFNEIPVTFNEK